MSLLEIVLSWNSAIALGILSVIAILLGITGACVGGLDAGFGCWAFSQAVALAVYFAIVLLYFDDQKSRLRY